VLSSSLEQRSVLFSSSGQVDQREIKVASVFSLSSLTLLVGHQKEQLACKKIEQ